MNRKAIFIAVLLTAFSVGMIGGVAKVITGMQQAAASPSVQQEQVAMVESVPTVVVSTPTDQTLPSEPLVATQVATISSDLAAQIGLAAAGTGESLAGIPVLVDFNGVVAYQVGLADGNEIYVNAQDGTLLYNSLTGSASAVINEMQAVQIAAQYLQYDQLVSVELTTYNGAPAYLVRFWNGANVYVNLGGQIVAVDYIQYAPPTVSGSVSSQASQSSPASHEYEDDNEYEEHEENDD